MFDKQTPAAITNLDLSRVSTIFPVLITRDDIGGCWGISHYLQSKAEGFFNRQTVKPRTVTPIFSLSSEGIEGISAYLQDEPLSNLLHGWYRNDPGRYWSFQTIDNSVINSHGFRNNTHLKTTFDTVFKDAIQVLFLVPSQPTLNDFRDTTIMRWLTRDPEGESVSQLGSESAAYRRIWRDTTR